MHKNEISDFSETFVIIINPYEINYKLQIKEIKILILPSCVTLNNKQI